jgi:pre-rRNA-processing protein IPI3
VTVTRSLSQTLPSLSEMQLQETILCATSPSPSQGSSSGSLTFHDIRTGTILASFKQTSAKLHCTDVLETRDAQGGFMMVAQSDKSLLNVYNYQKAGVFYFLSVYDPR